MLVVQVQRHVDPAAQYRHVDSDVCLGRGLPFQLVIADLALIVAGKDSPVDIVIGSGPVDAV